VVRRWDASRVASERARSGQRSIARTAARSRAGIAFRPGCSLPAGHDRLRRAPVTGPPTCLLPVSAYRRTCYTWVTAPGQKCEDVGVAGGRRAVYARRAMAAIEYATSLAGVRPEHLAGFFEGWPNPPSPERHLAALAGSHRVVLAREQGSTQIVGFASAISDGVLAAFIPLLEVLPGHRGKRNRHRAGPAAARPAGRHVLDRPRLRSAASSLL
jgi:hypothetical protein